MFTCVHIRHNICRLGSTQRNRSLNTEAYMFNTTWCTYHDWLQAKTLGPMYTPGLMDYTTVNGSPYSAQIICTTVQITVDILYTSI